MATKTNKRKTASSGRNQYPKRDISYSDAERVVFGSPILAKILGTLFAVISLGLLGWVGAEVTSLSKSNVVIQTQIAQINQTITTDKGIYDSKYDNFDRRLRSVEDALSGQGGPKDPWYPVVTKMQGDLSDINSSLKEFRGEVGRLADKLDNYNQNNAKISPP